MMNTKVKKTLIFALPIILCVTTIALTVILTVTINNYNRTISGLTSQYGQLQSQNEQLQSELKESQKSLEEAILEWESVSTALQEQKALTSQYEEAAYIWRDKYLNADSSDALYTDSFETVSALMTAIKKNPTAYNDKRIKLLGTVLKVQDENVMALSDYYYFFSKDVSESSADYTAGFLYREYESIRIKITNTFQSAAIASGDYVKLYGTVKVSKGEIYLDDCECSIVVTRDER